MKSIQSLCWIIPTWSTCFSLGPARSGVDWVPSHIYIWCLCMMSWCTQFLASPQFLAGFHLIGISQNEIESCPAMLHESQMLWTDGVYKARQSPCADNAPRLLPPQLFTCGNQTSQDETQSSITSCPVVSWKCFILLNTEKKRYRWETGTTLAASKEKRQHRRGKSAHFFIWCRSSVSEWQMKRWLIPSLFWFA